MRSFLKFILRFLLGVIILLLLLLMAVSLVLFVPKVQEYFSQQAGTFVSNKIGTEVALDGIYLQFPNGVSIEKLYIEDQETDTLLFAGNLEVAIDYFALLHAEIEVSKLLLENTTVNIKVRQDSSFNFDFIIDAFAGSTNDTTTKEDTSSSSISFDIGTISLNNVRFSYRSEPDGMNTSYSIGKLIVDVNKFDLAQQIYTANSINLENTNGSFEIFKAVPASPDTSSSVVQLIVGADEFNISKTNFSFIDRTSETSFSTSIGELKLTAEPIDLAKQQIEANNFKLANSSVKLSINSALSKDTTTSASTSDTTTAKEKPWLMALKSLDLQNFNFSFDDAGAPKINKGIDYGHLGLSVNQLNANTIYFNGIDDLGLTLSALQANEKSGLQINEAEFKLKMDSTSVALQDLILKTPQSSIDAAASLEFESLDKIADQLGNLKLDAEFDQTRIWLSDILYFAPDLETVEAISPYLKQNITINGNIQGLVSDLDINNFIIKLKNSTILSINGHISGLPETEKLSFNFKQLQLITNPTDLKNLLPDSSIPPSLKLPQKIKMNLIASGNMSDLTAQLKLITSYGNLNTDVAFQQPDTNNSKYQVKIDLPQFDLASLLQDTTLGNVGFTGSINGRGLSLAEMEMELDATVKGFEYLNYKYSDLNIKGVLQEEAFEGGINMNDSNLIFSFNGKADLDSLKPAFDFNFQLDGVDLQGLHISKNDYRINGGISADFTGNNLENLNGDLDVRDVLIIYKGEQYRVDSLLFVSIVDSGKTDINIKSNLMDASFKGDLYLSNLAETLQNHFKRKLSDTLNEGARKQQDFTFNVKIKDPDLLTEVLLPELNSFETGEIKGNFDSQKDVLAIELNFPKIDYADIIIDSLRLTASSDSNQLNSALTIKRVSYDTLSLNNISFNADVKDNEGILSFNVLDELKENILQLKGRMNKPEENLQFHFEENEQFINSKQWKVNAQNKIILGDSLIFKSVIFSNDNQKLAIETMDNFHKLSFSDFKLSSFFNLISQNQEKIGSLNSSFQEFNKKRKGSSEKDSLAETSPPLLRGILNGEIKFPTDSLGQLKAKLDIQQLKLSEVELGDLQADYIQLTNKDSIRIILNGNGNNMQLGGYLAEEEMNFNLKIDKLKMNIVEAFSGGQLKNTQGYITANATLKKQNNSFESNGEIGFKDVRLRSVYLGETYYLNDEKIKFSSDKITLNNFTILDSAKQSFITNGSIGIADLTKPSFNLKVKIDHFQFLNTTKESANNLFYGTVLASADLKVTGNLDQPIVNADLSLEEGTDISFVVPEDEASVLDREGIVAFVDKDEKIPLLLRRDKNTDTVKVDVLGINLTSVINIDENTKLTIVIDPVTGDRLKIQGGGKIRADVDPTGRITMNGLYTIKKGDYELKLYNLVKRQFALKNGSKLIWNGDPLEAKMDIKGVYTAKASPLGLLGDQVANLSEAERNKYKKRIPFKVLLILGGEILKPDISFRIELPEDQKANAEGAVANKLAQLNQDESELNRQVFSLIILKRFYSQSPTTGGGGGSYAARESVSQILTQQLNNLSDKYVKGVNLELSVDSYNDYSSEGELDGTTDVNLALSKNLFNDRVTVSVNGDFNVEDNNAQSKNSAVAGDVSVEYKITEDGKYSVKVFRKDEYEGIIEGEYIETGVSLIYTREFSKFKQLFKKEENETLKSE